MSGIRFFQVHKDGKNVNDQVTYEHPEQAARALVDAPEGAEVVEIDIYDNVIEPLPAQPVAKVERRNRSSPDRRNALSGPGQTN